MRTDTPQPVRLSDYRPFPFTIETTELEFQLDPSATRVKATLGIKRTGDAAEPLFLNGERLKLISIDLDGQALTAEQWPAYRQLFGSVFTDFHLFARLLGAQGTEVPESLVGEWLDRLRLAHKVRFGRGRLADTRFSQGQRKRLALLLAVLEGRDILVLDEWLSAGDAAFVQKAADRMQRMVEDAKIVVLATHDDDLVRRVCNRVCELQAGKIVFLGSTEDWLVHREANAA